LSIERTLFFDKDALKKYADEGEHQNRTPLEIINLLVPNCAPQGLELLTANLVRAKLYILENQIGKPLHDGTPWPRPVPGFVEYSQAITEANTKGASIDRAILSAGHASFIRKCLTMSGLEQPEIMITDETIRGLNSSLSPGKLSKPELMPLLLAKLQWLSLYDREGSVDINDPEVNQRITVIGDSDEKDGGLARNAGVSFIHVTSENSESAWLSLQYIHTIGSTAVSSVR
ncbi:MAG: hypothetical protein ACR2FM_01870, partial [Candidatus Saccharimonadales bacterium]